MGKNATHMRKKEIPSLAATWIDLEGIMLNEINQTEKDKYCMISEVEPKIEKLIERE